MGTVTPEPDNGDSQNLSKGTLKIYLTDALEKNDDGDNGVYQNIFISISRIEAHFVETDKELPDAEVAGGSIKGNWQLIVEWDEGFEVDLTKLKGEYILLASSELLPSGKYTQLRVFLVGDQATIVVNGEEEVHVLNIPSVVQTGIKLIHPFEIIPGYITELTLDFDAKKSIIKTGNGEYKLKPVIGIISSYSQNEIELGSIQGQVYNEFYEAEVIEDALVKIEGLTLIFEKTAKTDSGGNYAIYDIPFSGYKLTASAVGYIEFSKDIIIDSEEVVTFDFGLEPQL
jgi:hypothetical protein